MRAVPRGVAANARSMATTLGRRFVMSSSAWSASALEKVKHFAVDRAGAFPQRLEKIGRAYENGAGFRQGISIQSAPPWPIRRTTTSPLATCSRGLPERCQIGKRWSMRTGRATRSTHSSARRAPSPRG